MMRFIYLVGENKDGFYCDVTSEMSPCCVNCLRSCAVRPSGRRNYDLLIHYVRIWILDCWFDKKKSYWKMSLRALGNCDVYFHNFLTFHRQSDSRINLENNLMN